jgi:hypothetical protein
MTPEELDRKIEFIIQSQARLAAAQEQDREDRIKFEEWSKNLDAKVIALTEHQSRRMDRLDKMHDDRLKKDALFQEDVRDFHDESRDFYSVSRDFYSESRDFYSESRDFYNESRDFYRQLLDLQRQAVRLLSLILDRLPPASPNPN